MKSREGGELVIRLADVVATDRTTVYLYELGVINQAVARRDSLFRHHAKKSTLEFLDSELRAQAKHVRWLENWASNARQTLSRLKKFGPPKRFNPAYSSTERKY